jgi:hypothetical protein
MRKMVALVLMALAVVAIASVASAERGGVTLGAVCGR